MRASQGARALRAARAFLPALFGLLACAGALAQTPLVTATHTVTAAGEPAAVEHDFTIQNAGTYTVTLTDLGAKLPTPAPLAAVAMAVSEGTALAGTPTSVAAAGTPITLTATANSTYTIHVVGIPGSQIGSGPIEEDVTGPGGAVYSSIDTLSTPSQQPSGIGILSDTFTVSTSGAYTVTMTDLQFPQALETGAGDAGLIVIDATTGSAVATNPAGFGSVSASLVAGDTNQIIAYAEESSGAPGGLFSVSVTGVYGPKLVTVGSVTLLQTSVSGTPQSSFTLGSTPATLSLNNIAFPSVPLAAVGAALVDQTAGSVVAGVSNTGEQTFSSPSTTDTYQVYAYAVPDQTAQEGSYSVTVQQGTAFPFSEAQAVSSSSAADAFGFDTTIPSAGSYDLTLTDFKFPAALAADALAVVQDGQLINSATAAGEFPATLLQGDATLLAFGQEGGSGSSAGLMGVEVVPAGGGAAVFDQTEGIGTGFSSSSFTASSAEAVQATVADLGFPAALANLNLAVTNGATLVGQIASAGTSGSFSFTTSANATYQVTVLAQPATSGTSQQVEAGTYAMSVNPSPPAVTLSASSTTVTSGGTVTLTWTAQNAASCTASGGAGWTGSESTSGGSVATSALTSTTTFSLSCSGPGGSGSASVTVTVNGASGSHGGGGAMDPLLLLALALLVALRVVRHCTGANASRLPRRP